MNTVGTTAVGSGAGLVGEEDGGDCAGVVRFRHRTAFADVFLDGMSRTSPNLGEVAAWQNTMEGIADAARPENRERTWVMPGVEPRMIMIEQRHGSTSFAGPRLLLYPIRREPNRSAPSYDPTPAPPSVPTAALCLCIRVTLLLPWKM